MANTPTSGNDTLTGTSGNDVINALAGNDIIDALGGIDTIDGGTGSDTMRGGAGNDTYIVDTAKTSTVAGDTVTELSGAGIDTVKSKISYTLTANVENLILTGTAALNGTGNGGVNRITGNSAANRLDGKAGADTMTGGGGNDTYVVDTYTVPTTSPDDVVVELSGGGVDTVQSSVSYVLAANVENLILTGTAALSGTGNSGVNRITGNAAANRLDGKAGADTMTGGGGNDTYVVDTYTVSTSSPDDVVVELSGGGVDAVQSSVSYVLAANVENLILTGTAALSGTGNGGVNRITGNAAANRLDGKAGADTMTGGGGNDTYVVDTYTVSTSTPDDVVVELSGGGVDTVQSSVSYVLTANVENLILTGTAALSGTGNGGVNRITGNAAANRLDGKGGADTMTGGGGNDTYVVDTYTASTSTADDVVVELAGGGTDTVESSVSYVLAANVENLILTGTAASGTGNGGVNRITGNASANRLDGLAGADTMTGGGGNDTYVVDTYNVSTIILDDVVIEAAGAGTDTVESSVSYALTANVENLVLTGAAANGDGNTLANVITGNAFNNRLNGAAGNDTLTGNAGDDILDGGAGNDTMTGGIGNDTFLVDSALDQAIETNASDGTADRVDSSVSYTLGNNLELLILAGTAAINGTGNNGSNLLQGNSAANILTALGGNDTLNGLGGGDTMKGGTGDDLYVVDHGSDTTEEAADAGFDAVQSSITHSLQANVERLDLQGTADIDGIGNGASNILVGNSGNNRLDGGGGADNMFGGAGNDTFIVDTVNTDQALGDGVGEQLNQGTDLVLSSVDYILPENVENLTLTGSAVHGYGNELDNVIDGNAVGNGLFGRAGNDILDGKGGADAMLGEAGDDTYYVDVFSEEEADFVIEEVGEGIDTVFSSVDYQLSDNVENLVLAGTALAGAGNALGNTITGNALNNDLEGGGGADLLIGGAGDDSYYADDTNDRVTELSGEGLDGVIVTASTYTLDANVEALVYVGNAAVNATGNDGQNLIAGFNGNDTLRGLGGEDILAGGAGNDTLYGGAGTDHYYVNTLALNTALGSDTVLDFDTTNDEFYLDKDVFAALANDPAGAPRTIDADNFFAGNFGTGPVTAQDAEDRIIYNTANGALYYDRDGSGAQHSAILFAQALTQGPNGPVVPTLTYEHFQVVDSQALFG